MKLLFSLFPTAAIVLRGPPEAKVQAFYLALPNTCTGALPVSQEQAIHYWWNGFFIGTTVVAFKLLADFWGQQTLNVSGPEEPHAPLYCRLSFFSFRLALIFKLDWLNI